MKNFYIALITGVMLISCNAKQTTSEEQKNSASKTYSPLIMNRTHADTTKLSENTIDYNYATYAVVIADTGTNYNQLKQQTLILKEKLKVDIDTLGRYYDSRKKKIVLPKNSSDEMYADDYFPRRTVSSTLSLEYLSVYKLDSKQQTIAIVTGIFDDGKLADSALKVAKKFNPNAFKVNAKLYVGCMH
jgi:hypothetical protein